MNKLDIFKKVRELMNDTSQWTKEVHWWDEHFASAYYSHKEFPKLKIVDCWETGDVNCYYGCTAIDFDHDTLRNFVCAFEDVAELEPKDELLELLAK